MTPRELGARLAAARHQAGLSQRQEMRGGDTEGRPVTLTYA
jgi:hypothetical protein